MISELASGKAASTDEAALIAEKIRRRLGEPYRLLVKRPGMSDTTVEHRCTASIGVVVFTSHEVSQDTIVKCADAAMYLAKESGRDAVQFIELKPSAASDRPDRQSRELAESDTMRACCGINNQRGFILMAWRKRFSAFLLAATSGLLPVLYQADRYFDRMVEAEADREIVLLEDELNSQLQRLPDATRAIEALGIMSEVATTRTIRAETQAAIDTFCFFLSADSLFVMDERGTQIAGSGAVSVGKNYGFRLRIFKRPFREALYVYPESGRICRHRGSSSARRITRRSPKRRPASPDSAWAWKKCLESWRNLVRERFWA